jgi:hypothetical protein
MQAPSRQKVPDAVSPGDPLFWLALLLVITEWRNGFGRTPSPGHRGTHTRWSVIARCPRCRSQWFARESIVIIHHFSCIHIIYCSSLSASTPTQNCLSSITTRVQQYLALLLVSYLRFIHTGLSLAISITREFANPTATDTSSSIRCLLQRRRPAKAESCKCAMYMTICRAPVNRETHKTDAISAPDIAHLSEIHCAIYRDSCTVAACPSNRHRHTSHNRADNREFGSKPSLTTHPHTHIWPVARPQHPGLYHHERPPSRPFKVQWPQASHRQRSFK